MKRPANQTVSSLFAEWNSPFDLKRPAMFCRQVVAFAVLFFFLTTTVYAEIKPDFLMQSDPKLHVPEVERKIVRDFKSLWQQTLQRPEVDLQRLTAESIARAHQFGIPDLIETVPDLERILQEPSSHPTARFATARALIELNSRDSADKLMKAAQDFGADLRQLVEPAMAEWNVASARQVWLKRLDTRNVRARDLILAYRGLGKVREASAMQPLLAVVMDLVRSPDLRLEAAAAVGQLSESGLEESADRLSHETRTSRIINRRCAIHFLARHESEVARKQLIEMATDTEPSNAAAALQRLNEIDSNLVLPLAETAMKNADVHVRMQGAIAYIKLPTPARIVPVAQLLDDQHPTLRRHVCTELVRLAGNPDLGDAVRSSAMDVFKTDRWQGQEQCSLLFGALQFKPAATRLVEVLESTRPEVMVSSSWALRRVADPSTIPPILDKIKRQTEARRTNFKFELDHQVAHLFEACRQMNAKEAIPQMVEYIPKSMIMGDYSRCAAIWTLGVFYEGNPDKALAEQLIGRVTDMAVLPMPELLTVKQFCAISLARMKAVEHAAAIRGILEMDGPVSMYGMGLRWALKELTGEEFPVPKQSKIIEGNWFLEPLFPEDYRH